MGSDIVEQLASDSYEVVVPADLSTGRASNPARLPPVRSHQGDVCDARVLARVVAGVDAISHLAASIGNKRSIDRPVRGAEVNLPGTTRALDAPRAADVREVVVSSSAGIFGEFEALPIREDHPAEPETPYGVSKLAEEKVRLAYAKLYDIEAVALRYFNVYGPHQQFDAYGNVIPIFAFQMLRGESLTIFGDGEQTRDFVNVRDVVQANLKASAARGVSGVFNIGSGTRISINGLVKLMKEVSGIMPEVRHGPERPGDVRDSLADITAARDKLGYEPSVGMREGLAEYFGWARTEVEAK